MRWVALVCSAALLAAGCSSGDVFTFAEDDLCEWVSEEDVTSFVSKAYAGSGLEWDGSAVSTPPRSSAWDLGDDYCQWEATDGGLVIARGLTPSSHFESPIHVFSEDDSTYLGFGFETVSGHPAFDDNIIAANAAYGRLGFWVEDSEEAVGLEVRFPEGISDEDRESMLFDLVNSFLKEMGWTS